MHGAAPLRSDSPSALYRNVLGALDSNRCCFIIASSELHWNPKEIEPTSLSPSAISGQTQQDIPFDIARCWPCDSEEWKDGKRPVWYTVASTRSVNDVEDCRPPAGRARPVEIERK